MNGTAINIASTAQVLGTPHPRSWQKLETIGDCRRGLRWLFLQTKAGRLDARKAATLAVILSYAMKAVELEDLEQRIQALEADRDGEGGDSTIYIRVGGAADAV